MSANVPDFSLLKKNHAENQGFTTAGLDIVLCFSKKKKKKKKKSGTRFVETSSFFFSAHDCLICTSFANVRAT